MTPSDAQALMMSALLLTAAAVFVFEFAKRDMRANRRKCMCGHPFRAAGDAGHCQRGDADSTWYHPGGKYKPGECRACKCRGFVDDWRQDEQR